MRKKNTMIYSLKGLIVFTSDWNEHRQLNYLSKTQQHQILKEDISLHHWRFKLYARFCFKFSFDSVIELFLNVRTILFSRLQVFNIPLWEMLMCHRLLNNLNTWYVYTRAYAFFKIEIIYWIFNFTWKDRNPAL